jgi:two-component system CheB/CheR fusion protein
MITVNEEMANRNTDMSRLNSDLLNLQASTKLPIVWIRRDLTIRGFSTQAEKQFNLLSTDVGQPINNIRHNLIFNEACAKAGSESTAPDLESFIDDVISNLRERECEVHDNIGGWYSLRVRPYMTIDNKVDGAVLVLIDINSLKRSEQLITAARDYAEAIIRTTRDPLLILNADLRVRSANEAFYSTFKVSAAESAGSLIYDLGNGQWDIPKLRTLLEEILPQNNFFDNFEVTHDFKSLGCRTMLLNARMLKDSSGESLSILLGIQDVTE